MSKTSKTSALINKLIWAGQGMTQKYHGLLVCHHRIAFHIRKNINTLV